MPIRSKVYLPRFQDRIVFLLGLPAVSQLVEVPRVHVIATEVVFKLRHGLAEYTVQKTRSPDSLALIVTKLVQKSAPVPLAMEPKATLVCVCRATSAPLLCSLRGGFLVSDLVS